MTRILIVDDDVELCELVAEYLAPEGFEIETAHDGRDGAARAVGGGYALVVLDMMLPGMGGLDVLRTIRKTDPTPVLMLTARGEEVDRIVGLELGADDYMAKPFNPRELLARVRAVLRRSAPNESPARPAGADEVTVGDVTLDRGSRTAFRGGAALELTSVEFDLLDALLGVAGTVVTRDDLARAALGREFSPFDRSVDMHVSNLRKKLGPREDAVERIKSVRGAGYLYALPRQPDR